jgi:hypothetical protein
MLPSLRFCLRFSFRLPLLASVFLLSSCEFKSYRAAYRFDPGVTYTLRYSAKLQGDAEGSWGKSPYEASSDAVFSIKAVADTSKGQTELTLAVDSLNYRSSERAPEEDRYMAGRLRKYRAKLLLSRTGQALSLEEEPGLPSVEFSPLNFGRMLVYGLASFPDADIKKGARWESRQPLLDKFHPETHIIKRYQLSSVRETPQGRIADFHVEIQAILEDELAALKPQAAVTAKDKPAPVDSATLSGKGEVEFNLDKGTPVSIDLEVEGEFLSGPASKPGDSTARESLPLRLKQRLSLRFSGGT